jgi:hypothetical protein
MLVALVESSDNPIQQRYATRTPRQNITINHYGVSCFRHSIVCVVPYPLSSALIYLRREGPQAKHHYLVCGVQGDFTEELVSNPPTYLWTRQLKVGRRSAALRHYSDRRMQFAGVSNTSTLYRRGIRVCTGAGIGSTLSTCLQVGRKSSSRDASLRLYFHTHRAQIGRILIPTAQAYI